MTLNQEAKQLILTMALVAAVIAALNDLLSPAGGGRLIPWTVALLAVALLCWIWLRRAAPAPDDAVAKQAEDIARRAIIRREDGAVASAEADDLSKINGIGDAYADALRAGGIHSYARLAAASLDELEALFEAAGRNRPPRLETWAPQAARAAQGDWEGLRRYQAST